MSNLVFNAVIQSSEEEGKLLKNVVSYITSIDDRITCEDDADYEYDKTARGSSYIPNFDFYIGEDLVFRITRPTDLGGTANGFKLSFMDRDGVTTSNQTKEIKFCQYAQFPGTSYERTCYISYIVNQVFILVNIHSIEDSNVYDAMSIMHASSGNNLYDSYKIMEDIAASTLSQADVFDVSNCTFYNIDENINGQFLSRFTYKTQPGKVDYVKSSIYINQGAKQFDLASIYDCTEVSPGSTVSLKDGAYFAIGPHQLVKVS